jgi:hypothetical protein
MPDLPCIRKHVIRARPENGYSPWVEVIHTKHPKGRIIAVESHGERQSGGEVDRYGAIFTRDRGEIIPKWDEASGTSTFPECTDHKLVIVPSAGELTILPEIAGECLGRFLGNHGWTYWVFRHRDSELSAKTAPRASGNAPSAPAVPRQAEAGGTPSRDDTQEPAQRRPRQPGPERRPPTASGSGPDR